MRKVVICVCVLAVLLSGKQQHRQQLPQPSVTGTTLLIMVHPLVSAARARFAAALLSILWSALTATFQGAEAKAAAAEPRWCAMHCEACFDPHSV